MDGPSVIRLIMIVSITMIGSTVCSQAQTNEQKLVRRCEAQITRRFKQWRFAPLTAEVAEFGKAQHEDPTQTGGDFDGDGRKDVALLIQDGPTPVADYPGRLDSLHIAVCLDGKSGIKLFLIDKPYCGDGISRAHKGKAYYDFDTGKTGNYSHDSVSVYCFEKAGATYQFENGIFRQIVDSD